MTKHQTDVLSLNPSKSRPQGDVERKGRRMVFLEILPELLIAVARLMHLAEEDEFISKAAQAEIKKALAVKPNATVYSYPGQRHAFARHNGAHYNAAAAALANGRRKEFLRQQLRWQMSF